MDGVTLAPAGECDGSICAAKAMGTLAAITAALSDVQICPHFCCVIVLDVFFLLLLCFYIVYSCHVSIVLCHIAVLSILDTGQCKNSCLGAAAL